MQEKLISLESMYTIQVKEAKNLQDKITGLILKKKSLYGLLLHTRFGIHTFFMKYPIDVIVLNKENVIVDSKLNLKPKRIWIWNPRYHKVIEFASGIIASKVLQKGTVIKLIPI